jgi:hypothetical protein
MVRWWSGLSRFFAKEVPREFESHSNHFSLITNLTLIADMMELVDMPDLGSGEFLLWVQVPLSVIPLYT